MNTHKKDSFEEHRRRWTIAATQLARMDAASCTATARSASKRENMAPSAGTVKYNHIRGLSLIKMERMHQSCIEFLVCKMGLEASNRRGDPRCQVQDRVNELSSLHSSDCAC